MLGLLPLRRRLGLGARTQLARGALGGDAQLRGLVLDAGPQRAELALEELRRSLSSVVMALWIRAASRSADPTSFLRLALRSQQRALGLGRRGRAHLFGLATSGRDELGDLVLGAGAHLSRRQLGAGQRVGRLRVRLGDDVRRLLLGGAQQLLDARSEPRVRRALGLAELPVRLRELSGDLHGAAVELLDLGACVGKRLLEVRDARVNRLAFVSAEVDDGEGGPGVGHERSSWAL